jgi:hypothetical protein
METTPKKREFSMKYCPDLEDHVVVMTTGDEGIQSKICLSSHLCHTDTRISCGHEKPGEEKKSGSGIF